MKLPSLFSPKIGSIFSLLGFFSLAGAVILAFMPPAQAQEDSAGETVEESLKENSEQFLFPLHANSPVPSRPQAPASGSVSDGEDENAGKVIQEQGKALISNSAGASETVTQNPNSVSGDVVRGKDGKVLAYVDSQSSPGISRISDPNGDMIGTIARDRKHGGYNVMNQYGRPLGTIDGAGEVYNFYGQGIGAVPPGGSAADLYAAWSLIKEKG